MGIEHDRWQDRNAAELRDRVRALEGRLDNLVEAVKRLAWGEHDVMGMLRYDRDLKASKRDDA